MQVKQNTVTTPYEPADALANTKHNHKHLPLTSSADFSQGNSEIEGIIEPLHKPANPNNKAEIVSELSRIQSESFFNVPQLNDKLEKPSPGKVYFTGAKEAQQQQLGAESDSADRAQEVHEERSSANLTSSKHATMSAMV